MEGFKDAWGSQIPRPALLGFQGPQGMFRGRSGEVDRKHGDSRAVFQGFHKEA